MCVWRWAGGTFLLLPPLLSHFSWKPSARSQLLKSWPRAAVSSTEALRPGFQPLTLPPDSGRRGRQGLTVGRRREKENQRGGAGVCVEEAGTAAGSLPPSGTAAPPHPPRPQPAPLPPVSAQVGDGLKFLSKLENKKQSVVWIEG